MIKRKKIQEYYNSYHHPRYLTIDPLTVVHRFANSPTLPEIALLSALLSYGRVNSIIKSIESILSRTDNLSEEYFITSDTTKIVADMNGFVHRFHVGDDIALVLLVLQKIRKEYGSLTTFAEITWENSTSFDSFVNSFTRYFKETGKEHFADLQREYYDWLFPSPSSGSTCKRIAMFLRWLVRDNDGIDLGLWQFIPTSDLIIPVDTHVSRVARELGLTQKKSPSWKMAVEITENLAKLDKEDPVKFDFSLCRAGMIG